MLSLEVVFRPSLGGEVDRIEVGRDRLAALPGSCLTTTDDEATFVESFDVLAVILVDAVAVAGKGAGGIGKLKPP